MTLAVAHAPATKIAEQILTCPLNSRPEDGALASNKEKIRA